MERVEIKTICLCLNFINSFITCFLFDTFLPFNFSLQLDQFGLTSPHTQTIATALAFATSIPLMRCFQSKHHVTNVLVILTQKYSITLPIDLIPVYLIKYFWQIFYDKLLLQLVYSTANPWMLLIFIFTHSDALPYHCPFRAAFHPINSKQSNKNNSNNNKIYIFNYFTPILPILWRKSSMMYLTGDSLFFLQLPWSI